jgi:hypothetical protein
LRGLDLAELINRFGPGALGVLKDLFNFCFEFRNDNYAPVDETWIEDNLTLREISDIGREVAKLNRMDWLIPFFGKAIRAELAKL